MLAFLFDPFTAMSKDQYEEVLRRLDDAGVGQPEGRLYHTAFGPDERLQVFDIWDGPESFERFGATLMPILAELGVDVGEPQSHEVYNIIESAAHVG